MVGDAYISGRNFCTILQILQVAALLYQFHSENYTNMLQLDKNRYANDPKVHIDIHSCMLIYSLFRLPSSTKLHIFKGHQMLQKKIICALMEGFITRE